MKIKIRNAYEKNLKHIDLDIERNTFTVITGLSGSGKTSLLKDTLYMEAQRQYLEAMSYQGIAKPKVGSIDQLSPAILIDQEDRNDNPRSTLGTQTDIYTSLRMIFEKLHQRACPHCGENFAAYEGREETEKIGAEFKVYTFCPQCQKRFDKLTRTDFSFNTKAGACPTCHGMGKSLAIQPTLYDDTRTLLDGAVKTWSSKPCAEYQTANYSALLKHLHIDVPVNQTLQQFTPQQLELLKFGINWSGFSEAERKKLPKKVADGKFEGVEPVIWRKIAENKEVPTSLKDFVKETICPDCHGEKLNPLSRSVTVNATRLPSLEHQDLSQVNQWIASLPQVYPSAALIQVQNYLLDIQTKIKRIAQVGLDYLSLGRPYGTLSGGEAQRIKLAAILDSKMTEMIIILDEPTVGLHPDDTEGIIQMIKQIRDRGNTVLVIEHDWQLIEAADEIIEIGPGSGTHGGEILAQGPLATLINNPASLAAQTLRPEFQQPSRQRTTKNQSLCITNAHANNLQNISVTIPRQALTVVTGVSGSGKSSLVFGTIGASAGLDNETIHWQENFSEMLTINQKRPNRNKRSVIVTYLGLFDAIRTRYHQKAKQMKLSLKPADFSFNAGNGRCPNCQGLGVIESNQLFFENQQLTCPVCQGSRFKEEILAVTINDLSITDLLSLTIDQAIAFFEANDLDAYPLQLLKKTNLSYISLGQTTDTLSGGEMQRLSLARVIARQKQPNALFLMDEPTTGMHTIDVAHFMAMIQSMIDQGNTFIFIEHNLEVIRQADYLIELGPNGGTQGGQLIFAGKFADFKKATTRTSKYLLE